MGESSSFFFFFDADVEIRINQVRAAKLTIARGMILLFVFDFVFRRDSEGSEEIIIKVNVGLFSKFV